MLALRCQFRLCRCCKKQSICQGKNLPEMLPLTSDALELHIARANYQARMWINADASIMDTEIKPGDTKAWQDGFAGLEVI